jgi:hypothetical protein
MNKFQKRKEKLQRSLRKLPGRAQSLRQLIAMRLAPAKGEHALAFKIAGGLGDYLIAARFVRDMVANSQALVFDIYCPKPALASWVFQDMPGFRLALDSKVESALTRGVYVYTFELSNCCRTIHTSAKLANALPTAHPVRAAIRHLEGFRGLITLHATNKPHLDGYLGDLATLLGQTRHSFCHHLAGLSYAGNELPLRRSPDILDRLGLRGRPYLTISNGYDGEAAPQARSGEEVTKVFDGFSPLVAMLKSRHPGILLVQLGSGNSAPIAGVDLNLIGKTSLDEVSALLAGSTLHIDNEGGLVHLAASVGTRSAVFFGPTPANYFGYECNLNFAPTVCGNCWWKTPSWMTTCLYPASRKACMQSHDIAQAATRMSALITTAHPTD